MATPMSGTFDVWLTDKLTSVSPDIDTDVFVSYIIGILDENTEEDTEDSIVELLSGVVEPDEASKATKSILDHWNVTKHERTAVEEETDIGDKLSEMLGKQTLATVKEKKLTKEEAERKAAILAQYSQVSDGEETDEDDEQPPNAGVLDNHPPQQLHQPTSQSQSVGSGGNKPKADVVDPLLVRNVNKEEVNKAEREKREKAKEEGEKKKEKDKLDRQAQKQKQQDRKDAEKKRTQKGEKRR
ncbi:hypothetical protein RRG08_010598 [Elysia crispata]|uniref:Coiled-coil domain-containing protein 43 n=1 Tax=Elysia crispata TaxID=231223 RepID=A0AAE1A2J8_9GAST|nr:hypothetical protein RRG08_010598 [Elysia crispata]